MEKCLVCFGDTIFCLETVTMVTNAGKRWFSETRDFYIIILYQRINTSSSTNQDNTSKDGRLFTPKTLEGRSRSSRIDEEINEKTDHKHSVVLNKKSDSNMSLASLM